MSDLPSFLDFLSQCRHKERHLDRKKRQNGMLDRSICEEEHQFHPYARFSSRFPSRSTRFVYEYKRRAAISTTTIARNSRKPIPISV
mmetsp:Transcript_3068/g.6259  ORF Transcript_3068/g.6259 Transcript_3068/m.6259 type:complete len:87 (+) Transcript_3068:635-895(+)